MCKSIEVIDSNQGLYELSFFKEENEWRVQFAEMGELIFNYVCDTTRSGNMIEKLKYSIAKYKQSEKATILHRWYPAINPFYKYSIMGDIYISIFIYRKEGTNFVRFMVNTPASGKVKFEVPLVKIESLVKE